MICCLACICSDKEVMSTLNKAMKTNETWCYRWETSREWNKACMFLRSICGDCRKGKEGLCERCQSED